MSNTRLRIRTTAAVTALLGVVLVGQAAAGVRPDDRTGSRGGELATEVSYPDFVDRFVASHKARSLRPDDRSNVRGPGLSSHGAVVARLAVRGRLRLGSGRHRRFDDHCAAVGARRSHRHRASLAHALGGGVTTFTRSPAQAGPPRSRLRRSAPGGES